MLSIGLRIGHAPPPPPSPSTKPGSPPHLAVIHKIKVCLRLSQTLLGLQYYWVRIPRLLRLRRRLSVRGMRNVIGLDRQLLLLLRRRRLNERGMPGGLIGQLLVIPLLLLLPLLLLSAPIRQLLLLFLLLPLISGSSPGCRCCPARVQQMEDVSLCQKRRGGVGRGPKTSVSLRQQPSGILTALLYRRQAVGQTLCKPLSTCASAARTPCLQLRH